MELTMNLLVLSHVPLLLYQISFEVIKLRIKFAKVQLVVHDFFLLLLKTIDDFVAS